MIISQNPIIFHQLDYHFSSNLIFILGDNMSSAAAHFWDSVYAVMIVVAVLGNSAVLWIVIRKP